MAAVRPERPERGGAKSAKLSTASATSTGSGRREGPLLTLIPEGERTIDHRLQFVLVGKGARILAQRLVDSEMNESYRPRKSPARPSSTMSPPPGSSQPSELTSTYEGRQSSSSRQGGARRGSVASVGNMAKEEDDHLVLFCPVNSVGNSLARVRLCIIEGFSASMPPILDETDARDACVALLHWKAPAKGGDGGATPGVEGVGETVAEFNMRFAEMTHCMRFMPLAFLLSINETGEEAKRLDEVVSSRMFKDGRKMKIVEVEDDSEECMLDAIQDLVGAVISQRERALNTKATRSFEALPSRSRCCAIS